MGVLLRYFHTLRYLKNRQIFWQIVRKLQGIIEPREGFFNNESLSATSRKLALNRVMVYQQTNFSDWKESILRDFKFFEDGAITLLNERHSIENIFSDASKYKLWRYHLNYFEFACAKDKDQRKKAIEFIEEWASQSAWFNNKIGLEPYPISLRLVYCIKSVLNGGQFSISVLQALYDSVPLLLKKLEFHLLGNHLFENSKALVFAGLFFEGADAARWFDIGQKILFSEIKEQILPDGGHFELSTMYHVIVLEGLLDLYNLYTAFKKEFPSDWLHVIQKMRFWLKVMCHPDGEISFFNDACFQMAVSPQEIEKYAKRLGLPGVSFPQDGITHLKDSGYIRLQNKNAVVIFDAALIGPNYLPGHAHADTLSFEFSLYGQRTIVNSGTSTYEKGALRNWQRSTRAHNTVCINEKDSSEVWGAFRVARRAFPFDLEILDENSCLQISCSHLGYSGRHSRVLTLKENQLIVEDVVNSDARCIANYYFYPNVLLDRFQFESNVNLTWSNSRYYPAFNQFQQNRCLSLTFQRHVIFSLKFALETVATI